jgi:DDE superfamily endonuclease
MWRGSPVIQGQPPDDHVFVRTTESKAAAAARIGAGLAVRKRVELLGLLRSCFVRTETWQQAGKYVSALASELPRRNGWTIAQRAGDRTPDRTQRLLNRASWDTFAAMSQVRRFAAAGLDEAARRSGRRGGLVVGAIDETGQEKAGEATAGVKRQYLGCAGKVANGINTVHLAYVREKTGHALAGARQWIPREHTSRTRSGRWSWGCRWILSSALRGSWRSTCARTPAPTA